MFAFQLSGMSLVIIVFATWSFPLVAYEVVGIRGEGNEVVYISDIPLITRL